MNSGSAIVKDSVAVILNVANNFTFTWENIQPKIIGKKYFTVITTQADIPYTFSFGKNNYYMDENSAELKLLPCVIVPEHTDRYEVQDQMISEMKVSIYNWSTKMQLPDQISLIIQFFDN